MFLLPLSPLVSWMGVGKGLLKVLQGCTFTKCTDSYCLRKCVQISVLAQDLLGVLSSCALFPQDTASPGRKGVVLRRGCGGSSNDAMQMPWVG